MVIALMLAITQPHEARMDLNGLGNLNIELK